MPHLPALPVDVAQLPLWLARLANDASVQERFGANPLIFSTWYTLMGELVRWPDEVEALRKAERAKKLSFERAANLLSKVNYTLGEDGDVEHARKMLEGYAVHDWVSQNAQTLARLLGELVRTMEEIAETLESANSGTRMDEFARVLRLGTTEKKVLTLAVTCTVSAEVRSLLEQLVKSRRNNVAQLWEAMLGCTADELSQALSTRSVLRKSRLLKTRGETFKLPVVSPFWVAALSDPLEPLFDLLLKPLAPRTGAGMPARLAEEDLTLAAQVLRNAKETGVNLLLYGAEGLEKRTLLGELLARAGKQGFVLQELENAWQDLPTAAFVAQRLLFEKHGLQAVLVVEKPGDVLERKPSEFLRMMFGLELDSSHIAPFDELVLGSNPAPVVWAGPGSDALPEECVARFVFHAPLKKARREERRAQLERYVEELKLTKATREELLRLEDVSALQLETGLRAAKLSGATSRKEREAYLVQAVRRSLKALHRETKAKAKECVTEYSLKFVNYAGRFGPLQIMKALQLRPKGSLCLYGPPGTGKTQFVEHLAHQLGRPLITKKASDLLSKWVGENEKNIAAMFEEASNEEAILFLDEGDSFLIDRTRAEQSWQVTQVNELLQRMEHFEGIFIMATNLFTGLDAAALRRFTFKVEFRALDADQRWEMFVNESGLKGQLGTLPKATREDWFEQLCFMQQLTAGDFATVKRQALLLGETLTPVQWLEQLKVECDVKSQARRNEAPRLA